MPLLCSCVQVNRKKKAVLALREADKADAKKEGRLALLPVDEDPVKELAPVWDNSVAWGGFMATSANLRYQLVNGIEDRVLVQLFTVLLVGSHSDQFTGF